MGCCVSPSDPVNKEIGSYLGNAETANDSIIKLLFLGPGGSGKSTLFKNLQNIHTGFTDEYRSDMRKPIFAQIIEQMQDCLREFTTFDYKIDIDVDSDTSNEDSKKQEQPNTLAHNDSLRPSKKDQLSNYLSTTDPEVLLEVSARKVMQYKSLSKMTPEIADCVDYLWSNHPIISKLFEKTNKKPTFLEESTEYFWNEIDRFRAASFMPTEMDILNVRARTSGIIEKTLEIRGTKYLFVDVGGQRNERKKWINCFAGVHAIVFVVGLSSFNDCMFEDDEVNCMVDALQVFDEICNHKKFNKTHMILFFNKKDLFETKIKDVPITDSPAFGDFYEYMKNNENSESIVSDPNNFIQACEYIAYKFQSLNQIKMRKVYCHFTCAVDKENVDKVFASVSDIIIQNTLMSMGLQ